MLPRPAPEFAGSCLQVEVLHIAAELLICRTGLWGLEEGD